MTSISLNQPCFVMAFWKKMVPDSFLRKLEKVIYNMSWIYRENVVEVRVPRWWMGGAACAAASCFTQSLDTIKVILPSL